MFELGGFRYEGEWRNDRKEGKGTLHYPTGEKYEGEFKNDNIEGRGIILSPNGDK
jgi:hypothetical protein